MNHRIAGLLLFLLVAAAAFADEAGDRAEYLYSQFMAPCCYVGLLKDHQSGSADAMKEEILSFAREGKSDQEIMDFYVAKYGERILSQPVEEGFNRLAVIAPVALFVVGVFVVGGILKKQKASGKGSGRTEKAPLDSGLEDEIEREIREGM
ncbi:MAG: cytochrome c-type biogenesis protein CcmH [Candidatus Eisenbacteria bacterium]